MESHSQSPEFRNDSENFHPCKCVPFDFVVWCASVERVVRDASTT